PDESLHHTGRGRRRKPPSSPSNGLGTRRVTVNGPYNNNLDSARKKQRAVESQGAYTRYEEAIIARGSWARCATTLAEESEGATPGVNPCVTGICRCRSPSA